MGMPGGRARHIYLIWMTSILISGGPMAAQLGGTVRSRVGALVTFRDKPVGLVLPSMCKPWQAEPVPAEGSHGRGVVAPGDSGDRPVGGK